MRKILAAAALLLSLGYGSFVFSQGTSGEITGYLWSDTIGWISLNCSNHGTCGTSNYKLSVDAYGAVSGYAWSENIGWVTAESASLTGCPTAPCTARFESGSLAGWLKAVSGGSAESGGWDGFISLSGTSPAYGISNSGGSLSGYAWGSTVVGWLDAQYAATTYIEEPPCVGTQGYFCDGSTSKYRNDQCDVSTIAACAYLCDPGYGVCVPAPSPAGALTLTPSLIVPGQTVTVSWSIDDAVSCTVTEDNPSVTDSWSGTSGSQTSSALERATTYTLECDGLEGTSFTESATVSFRPDWQEI